MGPADREAVNQGRADYVPVHLHQVPWLFQRGLLPLDAAVVVVSPPDEYGFLSLGVEVIASRAALEASPFTLGLVHPRMPRTLGDTFVHVSRFSLLAEVDYPLPALERGGYSDLEARIGAHGAGLVEDGATLQPGAFPTPFWLSSKGTRTSGCTRRWFPTAF